MTAIKGAGKGGLPWVIQKLNPNCLALSDVVVVDVVFLGTATPLSLSSFFRYFYVSSGVKSERRERTVA